MKLSIEVDSNSTLEEVDFAVETLKAYKALRSSKTEKAAPAKAPKSKKNQNPNSGLSSEETPNYGVSSVSPAQTELPLVQLPMMVCDQSKVSQETLEALKNEPAGEVQFVPVPETTLENGFTYSAPAAPKSEFSAVPPPMFAPETMQRLANAKPAPVVAPFTPPAMPTVLPQKMNPAPVFAVNTQQQVVPFAPVMFR